MTLFVGALTGFGGLGLLLGSALSLWGDSIGAGLSLLALTATSGVTLLALLAVNRRPRADVTPEP